MAENKTKIIVESESSQASKDLLDVKAAQEAVAASGKNASETLGSSAKKAAEDMGKQARAAGDVGAAVSDVGEKGKKAGEVGAGGFSVLRISAERTAEALGVPARAANKMGDAVADMAKNKLPQWGTALGIAGVAIAAVTLATSWFIKQKEEESRARDENIAKIRGELSEMDQLRLKTVEMIAAQKLMSDAKKAELLLDTPEQIEAKRLKLEKLTKEYSDLSAQRDRAYSMVAIGQGNSELVLIDNLEAKIRRLDVEIKKTAASIKELTALEQGASGKGRATIVDESNPYWKEESSRQAAGIEDMKTGYLRARDAQINYDQARLEQARATGASMETLMAMELQVFDDMTSKIILSAKTRDEAEAQFDARKIQRATLTAQREKQIDQLSLSNKAQVYGSAAQLLDQAYKLSNEKYKGFFYAARTAAAAEAVIQGYLGASKAVGTFWGMEMGPVLIGMGYANAAMIMAQTFMGDGGGGAGAGGGASGSYDANSTTGNPTPAYQHYYEQDPKNPANYGSGWRPGEGQTGGQTFIVQGDVYAQDADAFQKKIVDAAAKNYKDQGDLYKSING